VTLPTGSRIGGYEIVGTLGSGGMGEVYRAHDAKLKRDVAIKVVRTADTADASQAARFEREARVLASLNHPNIAHVHGYEDADGVPALVMELVEGPTLADLIAAGAVPPDRALPLARQIADALDAAHAKGVVHRDLKPANIKVRSDGTVKVLDFGLAKAVAEDAPADPNQTPTIARATVDGVLIGTAPYMSPEQARGRPVDKQTDIWAFGCVLFELLSGRRPFDGGTLSDTVAAILAREPDWSAMPSATPASIRRLVERCLEKDPKRRMHDIADARVEIEDAMARRPAAGRIDDRPTHARGKRHWMIPAAAGSIVAVAAAVALYVPARRSTTAIDSIAVLPFVNQNRTPDADYLSDGLTESIINNLSQAASLRVIARASAFRFKSADLDPISAGKQLGVRAVVVGRVMQRGENLVVGAELVDVSGNKQLWGQQYNRRVADLFAIQEEIASEISDRLRAKLATGERPQPVKRPTDNLKAFQYYVQGRSAAQRRTRDDMLTSIRYFENAIAEDSNYALAYAGIAEAYVVLGARAFIAPQEGQKRAYEAANSALRLDPNLAEAHLAIAQPLVMFGPHDFPTAERELHRAIELSPGLAMAHNYLGLMNARLGRYDESAAAYRRARELDPVSLIHARAAILPIWLKRDYGAAWDALLQTRDLGPAFIVPAEINYYVQSGKLDEATNALAIAKAQRPDDATVLFAEGMVFAAEGKGAEALRVIATLEPRNGPGLNQAHFIAKIYAELHDGASALSWLERGLAARAIGDFFKDDPTWDLVRADPRFTALLHDMRIPN
jgi:serine/threonine protein kinase/tetratricopeptide (TPR) repeat protein